jgi:hypothetical protein
MNTSIGECNARSTMVTALFNDRSSAERAYQSVAARGYGPDEVDIVMSDKTRNSEFAIAHARLGNKTLAGAGFGSAIGGAVGALAAVLASVGTAFMLPGIGVVVAGPIAAALAGGGAGAATGGLIGALVGRGMPADRIKYYEAGVKSGAILLGVKARNAADADDFAREWTLYEGEYLYR